MRIETATVSHLNDAVTLLRDQFREHGIDLGPGAQRAALHGLLADPQRGAVLVAYDPEPVGIGALAFTWTLEHGGQVAWLDELFVVERRRNEGIGASASPTATPQAAVVGFAVSDDLEIVFDTIGTTRKMTNLRSNARIALVIGWDEEQTVQIDGLADEPTGAELDRLKQVYFTAWPDGVGRQAWKDITYVRVRPAWARYSDFRSGGLAVEMSPEELRGSR
ncbi:MAG: GNAT family N-acetyltransferase [Polyangiaceae bacterium]